VKRYHAVRKEKEKLHMHVVAVARELQKHQGASWCHVELQIRKWLIYMLPTFVHVNQKHVDLLYTMVFESTRG
jgi:hypothetical protein